MLWPNRPRARRRRAAQPGCGGPLCAARHVPTAGQRRPHRRWSSRDGRRRWLIHERARRLPRRHAQLQDRFDTRRLADRLDEKLARGAFTTRTARSSEPQAVFPRHRRCARPARLLVQGRRPGLRARDGRRRTRISELRRQRHVPQPRQHARQPAVSLLFIDFERPNRLRVNGRARVVDDDPLRASLPARNWSCACRRSASSRTARATSTAWRGRAFALCAARRPAADPEVEALRRVLRRVAAR